MRFVERDGTPVEAVQWDGTLRSAAAVEALIAPSGGRVAQVALSGRLEVRSVPADEWGTYLIPGDWVVAWGDGRTDVVKVDDFADEFRRLDVDEMDEEDALEGAP